MICFDLLTTIVNDCSFDISTLNYRFLHGDLLNDGYGPAALRKDQ